MATGYPQIQRSFTPLGGGGGGPSTFTQIGGGKQQPQIPYGIGGAGSRGLGGPGYGAGVRGMLRRRLEDEEAARFPEEARLPEIGQNPPTPNIYRGIPGFENYTGGPRILGDALSGWNKFKAVPGQGGYPTRDRVTEISQAMQRLGSAPVLAGRGSQGQGNAPSDYMDMIKRLLAERLGGG